MRSAAVPSSTGNNGLVSASMMNLIPLGMAQISLYTTGDRVPGEAASCNIQRPAENDSPCAVASAMATEVLPRTAAPVTHTTETTQQPCQQVPQGGCQQTWQQVPQGAWQNHQVASGGCQHSCQTSPNWHQMSAWTPAVSSQQYATQGMGMMSSQVPPLVLFPRVQEFMNRSEAIPDTYEGFMNAKFRDGRLRRIQQTLQENEGALRQQFIAEVAEKIHNHCDMALYITDAYFYAWILGRPMTDTEIQRAVFEAKQNKIAMIQDYADKTLTGGIDYHLDDDDEQSVQQDYYEVVNDGYQVLQRF